ncbi:MAG: hypothetical protein ACMXYC_04225 [Candidatus Woesearchaeota archaeon]
MKNVLVNLHRNSDQDEVAVNIDGELITRNGLYKHVPEAMQQKSLYEVFQYVCSPQADEHNKEYSMLEQTLCEDLSIMLADRNRVAVYAVIDGEVKDETPLDLSQTLDDQGPKIYAQQPVNLEGEAQIYKVAEFVLAPKHKGGNV